MLILQKKIDASRPKRSLVKAFSWESFSTASTMLLAFGMFGNLDLCMVFGFISYLMKLIMFYYHERIWHQIDWGKQ